MPEAGSVVLVLGAGASAPYGFPLGRDLIFAVSRALRSTGSAQTALRQLGHGQSLLDRLSDSLIRSFQPSIDIFLEGRPELRDVGKAAIASVLIPFEDDAGLLRASNQEWYEYLFGRLSTPHKDDFPRADLRVITFNYDRSFERALFLAIQSTYGCDDRTAIDLLSRIEIIHPYGQLGALPHQKSAEHRPYAPTVDPHTISVAAKGIRIISEESHDPAALKRAQEVIASAERILFLGFGYHPENLQRLGFPLASQSVTVHGSCFGMTGTEADRISARFSPFPIYFLGQNQKCLEALRNYASL